MIPSIRLNINNISNFIKNIENFIFDCDGVLWRSNNLLPYTHETLTMLRNMGKKLFFVTNNSTLSRENYKKKFDKFGLCVEEEEIYCSAYATACYLESINFKKKVYVMGGIGIIEELKKINIEIFNNSFHNGSHTWKEIENIQIDPEIGAIICGFDIELNYYKLCYAYKCITQNENCLFIATNLDSTYPAESGILPGGGSTISPLITATGKKPIVLGKPETLMLDILIKKFNLNKNKTCMVGDRLETDILFGKRGSLQTLLVFSGISTIEQLQIESNIIYPDYYLNYLGEIYQFYQKKNFEN